MKCQYDNLPKDLLKEGHRIQKAVSGDSMLPAIPENSTVQIEPVDAAEIQLGDIVYFDSDDGRPIIHRVSLKFKRENEVFIQTWGDNSSYPDAHVPLSHIHGRIVASRFKGKWKNHNHPLRTYLKYLLKRYLWYYATKLPRYFLAG